MAPQQTAWPAVDAHLLQEVVQRICRVGSPERIILFGSRARGDARPDSDLDLLLIRLATAQTRGALSARPARSVPRQGHRRVDAGRGSGLVSGLQRLHQRRAAGRAGSV